MDKAAERETHDFMNVDSFSQLPFIRPAPPPKEKGIRLFGIDFGDNGPPISSVEESESAETITNHNTTTNNNNNNTTTTTTTTESGESSRRFECHYCCRNFPTSQALGGHQNAHKRERQHAKRQHLHSAMVHGTFPEGQVYGLMNYRFGSYGSSPTMPYPTWNSSSNNNNTGRFYGSTSYSSSSSSSHHHHHLQQPINGSPLALWRIPNTTTTTTAGGGVQSNNNHIFNREHRSSSSLHPLPLFSGEEMMNTRVGGSSRVELSASGGSQNGYVVCDQKTSVNDHLSLDLHL